MTKTKKKKLPYGPVNVKMFQAIKKQILAEPTSLNMNDWGESGSENTKCGTVACICGWANVLDHLKTHKTLKTLDFLSPRAEKVLGISEETSDIIYYTCYWPNRFKNRHDNAKTVAQRAKVTAAFIDWICGK